MDRNLRSLAVSRACTAQRLRVGLTGLAAVFLTVLVAAAGVRAAHPAVPVDSKAETLAVLGVAPSSGSAATLHKAAPDPAMPNRTMPRSLTRS